MVTRRWGAWGLLLCFGFVCCNCGTMGAKSCPSAPRPCSQMTLARAGASGSISSLSRYSFAMICRAPVGVARREVYTAADCNATTCGEVSMKRVGILVLILCLAGVVVSLSACGQKGPLYLPKDTPKKQGS